MCCVVCACACADASGWWIGGSPNVERRDPCVVPAVSPYLSSLKLAANNRPAVAPHGASPPVPACRLSRLSSFDMAENESYDEPADEPSGDRPRRERVKKPPVPVLPDGTWVRIGDSCRSSTLRGQVGTVVAWGRQVEVLMRGPDGSEGDVRKINPTDLIALSEEPEFTAAEEADSRSNRDSGDSN